MGRIAQGLAFDFPSCCHDLTSSLLELNSDVNKGNGTRLVTKTVGVEASGCDRLAHVVMPYPGIELSTSRSQVQRPTVGPQRHPRG